MSINPILDASSAIKVHTLAASFALTLGPFIFTPKSRGKLHKTLGYLWIIAMATTALSSFFIQGFQLIGVFSPIHFLSVFILYGLCRAFWFIRTGEVEKHARTMMGMYWYGVLAAGIFTLIPGRTLNRAVFPDAPWLGYLVIACGALLILRHIRREAAGLVG
jgi:uncharacterized membrane protein